MQKYSRQRELLLDELRSRKDHPTADDMYVALRQKIPNISLGTVYRNLSMLSESGQVLRIEGEGPDRFDGDISEHYHFSCTKCGCVLDVEMPVSSDLDRCAEEVLGFKIDRHSVKFFGICASCSAEEASDQS